MNSQADQRDHGVAADNRAPLDFGGMNFHLMILSLLCAGILLFYLDTFISIVSIWLRSDTFLHGFLILPISIYLIWDHWENLRHITPRMYGPGISGLFVLSLAWWVCDSVGIQVGAQLIAVAMIPTAVTAVVGIEFARKAAFPLCYLILAVPFGEALIPWLMDYTATFTVYALSVTGIPVLRDGMYFSIPSGDFEVATACSGIRYLLATLALGVLYAYLAYRSTAKRLVFLGFSIVLPIVANGIRAYGIVLIAHFSEMRLAVGVDHIIFGWVFFGVVIAIMFAVGNRYRDELPVSPAPTELPQHRIAATPRDSNSRVLVLSGLAALCIVTGPLLIPNTLGAMGQMQTPALLLPGQVNGWRVSSQTSSNWRPLFAGASAEGFSRYVDGADAIDLIVIQYYSQSQEAELINSQNAIADAANWQLGPTSTVAVSLSDGDTAELLSVVVQNREERRLIWYWYDIDGERALSSIGVKLLEGRRILTGSGVVSSVIAISTPFVESPQEAEPVLRRFLAAAEAGILQCLHAAAPSNACQAPSLRVVQH